MLLTFSLELRARGHDLDIVSLQSSPSTPQIVSELKCLPIRKLIMPASRDPLRLPQLMKTIVGIPKLGIPRLIMEDLQNAGTPDLILIIDSPEVVPDVKTACLRAGVRVPVLYWDHGVIPFQFSRQNGLKRAAYYWFKRRVSLKATEEILQKARKILNDPASLRKMKEVVMFPSDSPSTRILEAILFFLRKLGIDSLT